MPGLKKKWIAANNEDAGDEEKELNTSGQDEVGTQAVTENPRKRPADEPLALKGLGEVLVEKRKRFIPPAELKLSEWLEANLEPRTDTHLSLKHLYKHFTAVCQAEPGADILDELVFASRIRKKYGKYYGLKEGSIYASLKELKDKKYGEKKKPVGGISLRDAIYEALEFYGNPWMGTRFSKIQQYIGSKYPALRVDQRSKALKRSIETQVDYDKIVLVRGIGKAGFYRIPGGEPPPPEEKKPKKEVKAEGEEDKGENGETTGAEGDKKDTEKDDQDKEKATENGDEKKEESEEKKSKPKEPKEVKKVKSYDRFPHGDPKLIEHAIPLAITYQSAPKAVGIRTIKNYIDKHYNSDVGDKGFKTAVEKGEEKGKWENISGHSQGRLHLLMDDFDPQSSSIDDQICAGIIACHEPKSAAAVTIKKYIAQYHPNFKVDTQPLRFKNALVRAQQKGIVTQLTGLGASGTFQLRLPWTPSPNVLAGEEDASDDEEASDEDYDSDVQIKPEYVSKGSKSRGKPKIKDVEYHMSPSRQRANSSKKRKAQSKGKAAKGRSKSKYAEVDSDEEESEEEEEEVPRKKAKPSAKAVPVRGRPAKAATPQKGKKGKKRDLSPLTDEDEEEEVEYTPSKSRSRGGDSKQSLKATKGKGLKMSISPVKPTTNSSKSSKQQKKAPKKQVVYKDDSEDDLSPEEEEDVSEDDYDPRARSSKKGKKGGKKGKKGEDSDDEPEYTPKKSKSRGGGGRSEPAKAAKSPAKASKAAKSAAPKAGKKGKGRKR